MDSETQRLINNILYSAHIIILTKGTMGNYPFYSFEDGKWLIEAMKINIDRDWNKEMKGLIIYIDDVLVLSYRYQAWVKRNYIPIENVFIPGEWINELTQLRDKTVNDVRLEEMSKNKSIIQRFKDVK